MTAQTCSVEPLQPSDVTRCTLERTVVQCLSETTLQQSSSSVLKALVMLQTHLTPCSCGLTFFSGVLLVHGDKTAPHLEILRILLLRVMSSLPNK